MKARNQNKQWTAKELRKRLLLWLLWCGLTVVLSTVAIVYQVGKSIPGSLRVGRTMSLALSACMGATQGLVSNSIVPYLASKWTSQKYVFTTVASVLMSCVIPAVVIICLDTGCLRGWVSLWKPCRSNSQSFQRRFICTVENHQDCNIRWSVLHGTNVDIMLLRPSDICNPHISWSSTSLSSCTHITLLRLQEIWLMKFITTGLVMPGVGLLRDKLPTDSGAIVGDLGICMAYVLVSSGHLPLMSFILLPAFFGQELVARVAWAQKGFGAQNVQHVAAPVVEMARWLSLMVHLASAAGDPRILALASAYLLMLIAAKCTGIRSSAGTTLTT